MTHLHKHPGKGYNGYNPVGEPLGRGTFATVYRVQNAKGQQGALKLANSKEYSDAVQKEARLLKHIKDNTTKPEVLRKHIPDIWDEGERQDGLAWFITPIYGTSLDKVMAVMERQIDVEVVVRWAIQICKVLQALADEFKIYHLDVKPSNILFASAGVNISETSSDTPPSEEFLCLADFGSAWCEDLHAPLLDNRRYGTMEWQPPEGLARQWSLLSSSFDVYCVGKVMKYVLERGRTPVELSADQMSLEEALAYCEISHDELEQCTRSEDLARVMANILAPALAQRSKTPGEAAAELTTCLRYTPAALHTASDASSVPQYRDDKIKNDTLEVWLKSFLPLKPLSPGVAADFSSKEVASLLVSWGVIRDIERSMEQRLDDKKWSAPYQGSWDEAQAILQKLNERRADDGWYYEMITSEQWSWAHGLYTRHGTSTYTQPSQEAVSKIKDSYRLPEWCADPAENDPESHHVRGIRDSKIKPAGKAAKQHVFHRHWLKGALRVVRSRKQTSDMDGLRAEVNI